MIRMPRHLPDEALPLDAAVGTLPRIDGWDLEAAAAGVAHHGGEPRRFAQQLAAAIDAGGDLASEPELARAVLALAGWRSGVLALRDEALVRLAALPTHPRSRAAAGAALGLEPEALTEFAARQATDRYWWPDRARWNGYVCAVGGFAGLGGAWIEPPRDGRTLTPVGEPPRNGPPVAIAESAGPSAFALRTGETWWRIDADVWGSRLTRTGGSPPPSAAARTARVSLLTRPDTYLAWIHVRDAA